jgi:hypothetical protein
MAELDGRRAGSRLSHGPRALVIDGPLKGRALAVTGPKLYALEPGTDKKLTYDVTQAGFAHGGTKLILRIATLDKAAWSAEELGEAMLTDAAKEAIIR